MEKNNQGGCLSVIASHSATVLVPAWWPLTTDEILSKSGRNSCGRCFESHTAQCAAELERPSLSGFVGWPVACICLFSSPVACSSRFQEGPFRHRTAPHGTWLYTPHPPSFARQAQSQIENNNSNKATTPPRSTPTPPPFAPPHKKQKKKKKNQKGKCPPPPPP